MLWSVVVEDDAVEPADEVVEHWDSKLSRLETDLRIRDISGRCILDGKVLDLLTADELRNVLLVDLARLLSWADEEVEDDDSRLFGE